MKSFRLIVSLRLVLFPLVFNLSFAQEMEVIPDEMEEISLESLEPHPDPLLLGEGNHELMGEVNDGIVESLQPQEDETPMDSSADALEGQDDAEESLSPQQAEQVLDSSPRDGKSHKSSLLGGDLDGAWEQNSESEDFSPDRGSGEAEGVDDDDEEEFNIGNIQEIPPTPLIKGGNPELASLAEDGGIILAEVGQEIPQGYPKLIISEIFRLGNNERIEITNLSDEDFSGKISLSGAKSSLYNKTLSISAYSSIILTDKAEIGLIDDSIQLVNSSSLAFNILDSEEILVSLIYSGVKIDTFNVEKNIIGDNQVPTNKPRPTFQKVYNNGREIQITTADDIFNITGNYIANPGKIIIKSGNPWIGNGPSDYPYNGDDSGNGENPGSGSGENPGTGDNTGIGTGDSQGTGNSNIPGTGNQAGTGNNSGNGDETGIGELTGLSSDFNLIISEIFYDDDDEWIEIFNIGSGDFLGDIELSGQIFQDDKTNHTYTNIQIPAHDFLIIADSNEMFDFSSVNNGNVNILLNEGNRPQFSISDTNEIQISLVLSGEKVDSFYAHEYRVNKRDDYGVSFHKILTKNGPVVTRSISNYDENLSESTYNYANPGVLYTSAEEITDYSISPQDSPQEENSEELDCSNVRKDIMTISEIFWGGSRYDPYVEFLIHEDIEYDYDYLLLSGSLLEQPITINLSEETINYDREKLQKNTRLILTTKAGALTEAGLITIVLHPDLKFNSFNGELGLYGIDGQSRQLLDIVKIENGLLEKSTYTAGYNHRCGIIMDNVMDFSPGFDESALKYFSTTSKYNEKVIETVKYVGGGGGCSCPSKEQLCGVTTGNVVQTGDIIGTGNSILSGDNKQPVDSSEQAPQNDENTQDSSAEFTPLSGASEGQYVKIVSLEPKTPESITLQSFLPYDIDFKNHNYYLKTSTATTKKYIDGILYANTIDTFTKNFGFVDAGACVYLYSGDTKLDSYCYSSDKQQTDKQQTKKEKSDSETESFNPYNYQIFITDIIYDPEGSDSGNESITIQSNSSKSLDLSKIKMKVNSTTKKISGILYPYSSITLTGSFGFPNSTKDDSEVVVILFYDNHIFSTYTYNPNKPKIEIPDGAVKVYSVIDGDTFRYRKEDGSLQSVRLLGVDAPESNTARYRTTECFGKEAKNYLTNLIKNQYVTLEYDSNSASSDAYGRMLAYVYLDGKLVNETLIAEGYAKEYTYKTAYSHQSDFKQAEEDAKNSEKGLRSSSTCGKSIEEEPEARGVDYEKLSIKISDVIYNPDGTDSGNEIVQLIVDNSQISAVSSIDFSDDFSLTIFPRSEYSTGTTKNKKLSEFGLFDLSLSSNITLKGNFGLPNNRATCVSLSQGNYTFDTRCYNPNGLVSEEDIEEIQTGDYIEFIPDVKIQSIIPNPSGKDSGKEEITLLRTPSNDFNNSVDLLDLSPDFSLLINGKTKKKLVGNLVPNQNITIKGTFGLPNSVSCVSLLYKGEELDEFCYGKASDGVKFNSNNTLVREIPLEELSIVKKITLVKKGDKLCVSYNKTLFSCKNIPNSTTEKNKKQLSMQNTFISELEKYMKSNYSMIYYDSDIKDYFKLYSEAKKAIKSGNENFTRENSNISITNISSLFESEYEQDAMDFFIEKIQNTLPENISLTLHQLEDKYNKKQVKKSDLSFLSLVE